MKIGKYHWYADDRSDDDHTTACGRDGKKVGGLITPFFRIGIDRRDRKNCKTCEHLYYKRNSNAT